MNLASVVVGDEVCVVVGKWQETPRYSLHRIAKCGAKMIVLEDGRQFSRATGRITKLDDHPFADIVELTDDIRASIKGGR
jgi:hypothetical protein